MFNHAIEFIYKLDWNQIIHEILYGSGKTMIMITAILIPVMIVIELMKDSNILNRAASVLGPVMGAVKLPKEGAFPMIAGVFLGITYGSGVIISSANDGGLTKKEVMTTCIFLAICHGLIEDTLLFTAIGANGLIIVVFRLLLAIAAVHVSAGFISDRINDLDPAAKRKMPDQI